MLNALHNGRHFSFTNETFSLLNDFQDFWAPEGYEDDTGFHFGPERIDGSRLSRAEATWSGDHI
jgi:hypothetical protein